MYRSAAPARIFRLLYEVAVATSGVLEPEKLARLTVRRGRQLMNANSSSLYWWVPERGSLVALAHDPAEERTGRSAVAPDEAPIGVAFTSGRAQVVHSSRPSSQAPAGLEEGVSSILAVPLLAGGRAQGVLCVRSRRRARWLNRHVEVMCLLGTLVAPALAAARYHADLAASEESFRAVFSDAQDQLLALVRELSIHRTDPTPHGEPISMSEAQALMELRGGEELSQTALAVRLRLEKSTVSRLAAQMEARGWLERNRDPSDARLVRLGLTAQGRALARDLAAMRTSKLQGILKSIPEPDRESFLQALKLVVQALHHSPGYGEGRAEEAG